MNQLRPFTIAFYNGKGGVGKTTLSVLTAHLLHEMGLEVLFIDTDPQCSAYQWSLGYEDESRGGLPFPVHIPGNVTKRSQLLEFINQRRSSDTSVLIFDLPPVVDNLMTRLVLNLTDLAVMPVIPDGLTVDAMPGSLRLIEDVSEERRGLNDQDPGVKFKIVMNRVKKATSVHKSRMKALRAATALSVYDTFLGDLNAFINASSAKTSLENVIKGRKKDPLIQLMSFRDELLDDAKSLGWDLRAIAESKSH